MKKNLYAQSHNENRSKSTDHGKRRTSFLIQAAGFAVSLVLTGFCLTGCDKPALFNKEDDSPLTLAMKEIEAGNYNEAAALLEAIPEGEEDERLVKRGLGMAHLEAHDYEKAKGCFEEALALSNGILNDLDVDISYYLAVAEYKSGNVQGAIDTYTAILSMYPKEDNACYLRGKAYLSMGDKSAAMADYDRAIELAPADYDHYVRICTDLSAAGYESEGKTYIEKAMNTSDKLSDYQQGIFNYYMGDYTSARNNLENARKDDESGEDLIIYLGRAYEKLGDLGYAISLYESYIAANPQSAGCYADLGLCRMAQADYEGALETFEAGLATGDETYRQILMYDQIVAYEKLLDFETAKTLCASYVNDYPDDEKALRENQFLSTR